MGKRGERTGTILYDSYCRGLESGLAAFGKEKDMIVN